MTENNEKHSILFAQAVMMFTTTALQGLGQVPHPATGKTEVQLEAARMGIDMLDMLAVKTRGNLDGDETRMLEETLSSLKLAYVQAAGSKPAEPAKPSLATEPAAEQAGAAPETESVPGAREKEPRFRKSYG